MNDSTRQEAVIAPLEQLKQQLDEPKPARKGGGVLLVFCAFLLVLIAAAVFLGYQYLWPQWQQMQQQQVQVQQLLQQQERGLQQQLQLQQQNQQQLQQQLQAEQQAQLASLRSNIQQQQQYHTEQNAAQLQAVQRMLQQQHIAPPRHWQLSESLYLLQLATLQLGVQHDMLTAKALLTSADEKLAALNDASLMLVRQAIAADLQYLNQQPVNNLPAIQVQLHELRQLSLQLPLKNQQQALELAAPEASNQLQDWRSTLRYYWHNSWSKLVQVRPAVPEDYFSLSAEQQLVVQLSLQQQLLLAELAAMQQNTEVYHRALQQASHQLQRYFAAETPQVQQMSQHISALAGLALQPDSRAALKSAAQLQDYMQRLNGENE